MKLAAVKPIPPDHISLTSQSAMQTVCQPLLNAMNLNFYACLRLYPDGTLRCLTTNTAWHQYLWDRGYLADGFNNIQTRSHLWAADPGFNEAQLAARQHGIDNKFDIVQVQAEFIDIHVFGTDLQVSSSIVNELYLNPQGKLNRFMLEFYSHSGMDRLIREADQKQNRLPLLGRHPARRFSANDGVISHTVTPLNLKTYNICGVRLSKRQMQSCLHLHLGRTQEETAKILCVERRTVKGYLDLAQQSLGCANRAELKQKLIELKFHTLVDHVQLAGR